MPGYTDFIAVLLGILGFILACFLIGTVVLSELKQEEAFEEEEEEEGRRLLERLRTLQRQLSQIKR